MDSMAGAGAYHRADMRKSPRLKVTKRSIRALIGTGIGLGVGLGMVLLRSTHPLEALERLLVDSRTVSYRGTRAPDPDIVLAVIDDVDLQTLQAEGVRWPWNLDYNALAFEWLAACGVRAIAVDMAHVSRGLGPEEYPPDSPEIQNAMPAAAEADTLAKAFTASKRVVLGFQLLAGGVPAEPYGAAVRRPVFDRLLGALPPLEGNPSFRRADAELPVVRLLRGARSVGFFNMDTDDDGIVRRVPPLAWMGDRLVPALSLSAALLAVEGSEFAPYTIRLGSSTQRLGRDGTFLLNYRGGSDSYPKVRPSEMVQAGNLLEAWVKAGRVGDPPSVGTAKPAAVRGKIVIWGINAVGFKDYVGVPGGAQNFPGPEAHATIIDNLLHGDGRVPVSRWANGAIVLALALVLGFIGGHAQGRGVFLGAVALVIVALWVVAYQLFKRGWSIDLFTPTTTCVLTYAGVMGFRFLTEGRRNKWLEGTFSQYLSPAVIEALKGDPSMLELGGRKREISVLFSDVKGFTTISEALSPGDLVRLLNDYLTRQSEKVLDQDGVIDKFIGDAVMAFFGDPVLYPDHALRACTAALRCLEALKDTDPIAHELGLEGLTNRIGINSGSAIVGNMGSAKRFNYTCMGDTVNLSSRLEGANKAFGSKILLGPLTYEQAKDRIVAKPLARVQVVGKNEPVAVYELVGLRGEAPEDLLRHAAAFTAAHAALLANPTAFDILVTDYNMPGFSGVDLLRQAKLIRPDLPVALASGYVTPELEQSAMAEGANALIYKPNDVNEFCDTVQWVNAPFP